MTRLEIYIEKNRAKEEDAKGKQFITTVNNYLSIKKF